MLNFLTPELIIEINKNLGYSVLNTNLVGSAISSWHYYKDIEDQITSVVYGIVKNHSFRDGNKRTAVVVYYTLCSKFKIKPITDDAMFKVIVAIASSKDLTIEQVKSLLF